MCAGATNKGGEVPHITSVGSGWEMLSHLFAPDTPVVHARAAVPNDESLRRAAAVLVVDPRDRGHARLNSLGFTYIRDFALMPDATLPRWLIPIGDSRASSGAFALHPPYGRAARTKYALARAAARVGAPIWYRHTLRLAARELPAVESWINEMCGVAVRLGFARGAFGARPKPGLIALDASGRPVAFGKLARESLRRSAVAREALALTTLASDPRTKGMGPRLLGGVELNGTYVTIQEPVPGRVGGAALSASHAIFLDALVAEGGQGRRRPVTSSEFMQALRDRATGEKSSLLTRLAAVLAVVELPPAITHGDFAPWNVRLDEAGVLRAFDWEWWCGDSLPLIDQLHHELQVAFLIGGRSGQNVASVLAGKASARPFGLEERETHAVHAVGILDYLLRIADDGYGHTPLARRYTELLTDVASAALAAG